MKVWSALFLVVFLLGQGIDVEAVVKKKRKAKPSRELVCGSEKVMEEYRGLFRNPKALEKQNQAVDFWQLERVEDEEDLEMLIDAKRLVGVPRSHPHYYIDGRLDERTHFIRPFTMSFIESLSRDFDQFTKGTLSVVARKKTKPKRKKIKVTALVRWYAYQEKLAKRLPRGQAVSSANGYWCQSSHLSGATFDISLKNWSKQEICWLLKCLKDKQLKQEINAIWEPKSKAFHIMVFPDQRSN